MLTLYDILYPVSERKNNNEMTQNEIQRHFAQRRRREAQRAEARALDLKEGEKRLRTVTLMLEVSR